MLDLEKIDQILAEHPKYRKAQVSDFLFRQLGDDWSKSNLPQDLKRALVAEVPLAIKSKIVKSADDHSVKALIYFADGLCVETVLMRSRGRNSVCVSTQVGCPMGCKFCASGKLGFSRNLTSSEIIVQIIFFLRYLKAEGETITNLVFMGMGEPFLNYENVTLAIRYLAQKETLGLSMRRFSISTSGIVPKIKKLATEKDFPVNLAISLHAATDDKRSELMPVNLNYPLRELSEAISEYFLKTKRKLMFEYILLSGLNMNEEDARALRDFINSTKAAYTLNLIPFNETESEFMRPSEAEIKNFKNYLDQYKIKYVQRYSFGGDIKAACGQLAKTERS